MLPKISLWRWFWSVEFIKSIIVVFSKCCASFCICLILSAFSSSYQVDHASSFWVNSYYPKFLVVYFWCLCSSADWRYAAEQFVKRLPDKIVVHCKFNFSDGLPISNCNPWLSVSYFFSACILILPIKGVGQFTLFSFPFPPFCCLDLVKYLQCGLGYVKCLQLGRPSGFSSSAKGWGSCDLGHRFKPCAMQTKSGI